MKKVNALLESTQYLITGGVINNIGIVHAIKTKLGLSVNIPEEPQIVGALGAALIAKRISQENQSLERKEFKDKRRE